MYSPSLTALSGKRSYGHQHRLGYRRARNYDMAPGSSPGLEDTVVPDSSAGYLDAMDPMAVRPSNHHMT